LREALGDPAAFTPEVRSAFRVAAIRRLPRADDRRRLAARMREDLERTGFVRLGRLFLACCIGLRDEAFAMADASAYHRVFEDLGPNPAGPGVNPGLIFMTDPSGALVDDPRFVGLCAKLGLCDYFVAANRWPDCAGQVSYDFRAEAYRLSSKADDSP
jgi:hypothetical protein